MPKVSNQCKGKLPERVQYFLEKAELLLCKYGLLDWTVVVDRSVRRAGCCYAYQKRVSLSYYLLTSDNISEDDIINIILHEVAHAIVGVEHGHDEVWKEKAVQIGSDGNRCHTLQFAKPKAYVFCPCGRIAKSLFRVKKQWLSKTCSVCGNGVVIMKVDEYHTFMLTLENTIFYSDYIAYAASQAAILASASASAQQ
jgi:predicted SprT family Zn-dependent metalloprotease